MRFDPLRLFAVSLFALLATACGSSPAVAPVAVQQPVHQALVTGKAAARLAALGVLKPDDLPGTKVKTEHADAGDAALEAKFYRCMHHAQPRFVARNFGRTFTLSEGTKVGSSADVAPTLAAGLSDFSVVGSTPYISCGKRLILADLREAGFTVKRLAVERRPLEIAGATKSTAVLTNLFVTKKGRDYFFVDMQLASLIGQTEITLDVTPRGEGLTYDFAVGLLTAAVNRVAG